MRYAVVRSLWRCLHRVQRFPEECLLQISCDQGITSVVIWCYHILGPNFSVQLGEQHVVFGDEGRVSVDIRFCASDEVSVVLLTRASLDDGPLFRLDQSDVNPLMETDRREAARRYLRHVVVRWI
jgi:hypothetical protein